MSRHEVEGLARIASFFLIACVCVILSGCGETISGVGKDMGRMGRGVNTFFFRQ